MAREVRGLDAFLARVGATRVEEYLCRFGRDPLEGLERRLRWAAWHFSDPDHAEEAQFLIAYHGALREKLAPTPIGANVFEADTVLLEERPRRAWSPPNATPRQAETPRGPGAKGPTSAPPPGATPSQPPPAAGAPGPTSGPPPPPRVKTVTPTPPPNVRTITPNPPPIRNVAPTPPPPVQRSERAPATRERGPAVTLPIPEPARRQAEPARRPPASRSEAPSVLPLIVGTALMSASIGAIVASVVLWWAATRQGPSDPMPAPSVAEVAPLPEPVERVVVVESDPGVALPVDVATGPAPVQAPAASVATRAPRARPVARPPDLVGAWSGVIEAGTGQVGSVQVKVYRQSGDRFAGWVSGEVDGVPTDAPISGRWDPASGAVRFDSPDGAVRMEGRMTDGVISGTWHRDEDATIRRFTLRPG